MKVIIVYTHSWKHLCELYDDHSLYHVNICYEKNICTSIRHYQQALNPKLRPDIDHAIKLLLRKYY
jgi:hypothetical protein